MAVDFQLVERVDANARLSNTVITKIEGLTERAERRFDDVLTTKRLRVEIEVTGFMVTVSGQGAAERVEGVSGIGIGVTTISTGRAAIVP